MLICPKCKSKLNRTDTICKQCGQNINPGEVEWLPYSVSDDELDKIVLLSKSKENIPFALWFNPDTCTLHLDGDAPESAVWIYDVDQEETPDIICSVVNDIMKDVDYGVY